MYIATVKSKHSTDSAVIALLDASLFGVCLGIMSANTCKFMHHALQEHAHSGSQRERG